MQYHTKNVARHPFHAQELWILRNELFTLHNEYPVGVMYPQLWGGVMQSEL